MALRKKYPTQEDIPEELRDYYTETSDGWVLDLDDPDAGSIERVQRALQNEREQRRKAVEAHAALKKQLGDLDPEAAREALEKLNEMEESKLRDSKQYEELAERKYAQQLKAIKEQLEQHQAQLQSVSKERQQYRDLYQSTVVETQLAKEALEAGADPKKLKFLLSETKNIWRLNEDNQLLPIDPSADEPDTIQYGSDGKPLTMKEQVSTFLKEYPFFVLESSGSGAQHRTGAPRGAITMTREQLRNTDTYLAAKEQAQKSGVALETP